MHERRAATQLHHYELRDIIILLFSPHNGAIGEAQWRWNMLST